MKIALLPGDGIGPEIVGEAVKVLDSVAAKYGHQFEYSKALVGACAIDATGDPYPAETHAVCEASDVVLFGAIGDPKYDNNPAAKVRPEQGLLRMRKSLGLLRTFVRWRCSIRWPGVLRSRPKLSRGPISFACVS